MSVDWREKGVVNPVKNQGKCGSCYIFGALGPVESAFAIKSGKLKALSEQYILSCGDNKGCPGGLAYQVYETLITNGTVLEEKLPYN
ncbi:Cysteine proteinase 3, partial [Golovinomyces cichoracearum]